jgi:putative ABC transport system permease protein
LLAPLLTEPDTVLVGRASAERLGFRAGERLAVELSGSTRELRVVGFIEGDGPADPALEGLLLADLSAAQEMLGRIGRLDRIDLRLDNAAAEARLRAALPADVVLRATEGQAAAGAITAAFAANLQGLSALALLVGMFLIYNTMNFNLLQRRPLLASLRLLGVTRAEIVAVVLLEAASLGLLGALLGLALALAAVDGLLQLLTRTINDVYFVLTVSRVFLSPAGIAQGLLLGPAAAVLAALPAALEAAWTRPAMAQRRSLLELRSRWLSRGLAGAGTALMLVAYGLLQGPGSGLAASIAGVLCLALGYTLLTPALLAALLLGLNRLGGRWLAPLPRLALRGIGASLSRTGVAAAALSLGLAMSIGTGAMVYSFRQAVADWLERLVQADLHVSLPASPGRPGPALPAELLEQVRAQPGIARISTAWRSVVETGAGPAELVAAAPAYPERPAYRFKGGDGAAAWAAWLQRNVVLVSEPFASRHRLAPGDSVVLQTPQGAVALPVAGIFFDYRSEQGVILMHRRLYDRLWNNPAVSSVGLYLEPDRDPDGVRDELRHRLAGAGGVLIRSNREIRDSSMALFDRTFTVTRILQLQALGVAIIGILSALLALQMERGRELALLRALGLTPGQAGALVFLQSALLGACAGLLALPLGALVAAALVYSVNLRSFGWSMELALPASGFAEALLLAVSAALLAGIYPAWRAARTAPAAALREE